MAFCFLRLRHLTLTAPFQSQSTSLPAKAAMELSCFQLVKMTQPVLLQIFPSCVKYSYEVAYQLVHDDIMLDSNPRLNLAAFVTTWMEPDCDKLIEESLDQNLIDADEHPFATHLQAQKPVKRVFRPAVVVGGNLEVCWEKFANYFHVEFDVAAILGTTFTGEFEDVKLLNDMLEKANKETGQVGCSNPCGGFVAPLVYPELVWDFQLPTVKSINVNGHKYGLVYPGIGWGIWRSKEDLPEDLIFRVNYLGADQATFTLNFSRGAAPCAALPCPPIQNEILLGFFV